MVKLRMIPNTLSNSSISDIDYMAYSGHGGNEYITINVGKGKASQNEQNRLRIMGRTKDSAGILM